MSDLIRRQDVLAYPIRSDHYDREHGNKHFIAGIESVMEYVECLPSAEPKTPSNGSITSMNTEKMHDRTMGDLIRRRDVLHELDGCDYELKDWQRWKLKTMVRDIPSAEPERLSDDDFETIRIHLNAQKEKLCNQQRWEEAKEYQRIIDRFMAFASAQPEIIRCGQCKYAEAADSEDNQDGYTCQFHRGSIWFSGSYCSWAERREECTP